MSRNINCECLTPGLVLVFEAEVEVIPVGVGELGLDATDVSLKAGFHSANH